MLFGNRRPRIVGPHGGRLIWRLSPAGRTTGSQDPPGHRPGRDVAPGTLPEHRDCPLTAWISAGPPAAPPASSGRHQRRRRRRPHGNHLRRFRHRRPGRNGGAPSAVYVVFGSATANRRRRSPTGSKMNPATGTYYYTPNDRVGDLGTTRPADRTQTNPITGTDAQFPLLRRQIRDDVDPTSGLGASVAGVGSRSGRTAITHSSSGHRTDRLSATQLGTGTRLRDLRHFWTTYMGQTVDLDTPSSLPGPVDRHAT